MSLNEYSRWLPEPVAVRIVGHDQVGARPVVELAVGDAGGRAGRGAAVADAARRRAGVGLGEQRTLLGGRARSRALVHAVAARA